MDKPSGISKQEYQRRQEKCEEEKFTNQTNRRLQDIELSLLEHEKQLNIHRAFHGGIRSDVNREISEIMNASMTSLKEFRQEIGDFKTHMKNQDEKLQDLKEDQDIFVQVEEFKSSLKMLDDLLKDLRKTQKAMHTEFNGLIDRLKQDFTSQIKALKEELIARPTGISELQRLLESKIELVELNGQNSVLRSANNEKQLLLVERKIDNIYQLIKKIELSNQE